MSDQYREECADYVACPKCGSSFVEWDQPTRRWRCLVRACDWIAEKESSPGCWNYATGSCFYGYDKAKGHRPGKQIGRHK